MLLQKIYIHIPVGSRDNSRNIFEWSSHESNVVVYTTFKRVEYVFGPIDKNALHIIGTFGPVV